jgi:hypothetical protein
MKSISNGVLVKLVACSALAMGLSSVAAASCGDSFAAMASGKAIVSSSMAKQLEASTTTADFRNSSIVGLWYVQFISGGVPIQEAFQAWNVGGTEVHNPNVDPRGGTMCLGTWVKTPSGYKLAHRVWNYDTNGNFLGTIHVSETIYLTNRGNAHTGSFKLEFYDPDGNFQTEVTGTVTGQRIRVE